MLPTAYRGISSTAGPVWVALRRLRATPGFAVAAILTLALGVGANSLAFGALHGLLVRPLPFTDADRLVWVIARDAGRQTVAVSPAEASGIALRATSLAHAAVIGDKSLIVEGAGRHVEWHGLWVTPGLFDVLDVTPAAGRPLGIGDMRIDGTPVMMLGYERWQRDFGTDPAIIGRVIHFADNKHYVIVGVLPRGLEFPLVRPPQAGHGSGFTPGVQDFWVMGQDNPRDLPGGALIARLAPGVTAARAADEARAIAAGLAAELPNRNDGRSLDVQTLREHVLGVLAPALPVVQAFAILVLLVACGNLANLMLGRALRFEVDDAIRSALGASRMQRTWTVLAESGVVCAVGSAAGLLLAWAAQLWLRDTVSAYPAIAERLRIDAAVLVFTAALCAIATVLCAVAPALARSSTPLTRILAGAMARHNGRTARWRWGLVVVQITLALALMAGAGLLRTSLDRLLAADTGYQREGVVTADVLLYVPARDVYAFFARLYPRLKTLPGVEAVGVTQSTPLTGKWTFTLPFVIAGRPTPSAPPHVAGNFIGFDYFEAMGIPILAGRRFNERELFSPDAPSVIINDEAARVFFPDASPIGNRLMLTGKPREIVGVVKGTRDVRIDAPAVPQIYQPMLFGGSQIVVRAAVPAGELAERLRRELLASDPRLIVKRVAPLDAIVAEHVAERRVASVLVNAFAFVAFVLAVTGLYAVVHLSAVERRREFAVRVALGARRADLMTMIIRQGVWLAAGGVACGAAVTLAGSRILQNLLYGVSATDPGTLATATLVVLAVAMAACLRPAWQAASVDPLEALRLD